MNLCLVCLRTDRLLKLASNVLEEFHYELCDFSGITTTFSYYFCSECEYLLTKFYKFKKKCIEALKIYQKWISGKASKKQPLDLLYTMIPPSSLGIWVSNPEKVGNFNIQSTDSQIHLYFEEKLINHTEVKLEYDQHDSSDNTKLADVLKPESNSKNIPVQEQTEIEIKNYSKRKQHLPLNNTDDSDECNDTKVETEVNDKITKSVKKPSKKITPKKKRNYDKIKENDKLSNDNETEKHLLLDNLEELLEDDSDESTDLNITKAENSKKKIAILKPQKSRKKITPKSTVNDKVKENDKKYRSVFDIEYLTTPEMKVEEFERRKTYECYVTAEHKCEVCYQVFKSSKFLEYHTNKWHNESAGSVYCPLCKIWSSKSSNHRLTHTMVFKCKLCPLVTYHRESMQNHFEQHKGKQYRCEQCNITCKSKSAYRSHMGKFHRRGRNVCEGCGRGFRSPIGLTIHKNKSTRCTVSKEPTNLPKEPTEGVRCDECDVTLPSQEVYEAHVTDVHEPSGRGGPFVVNSAGLPETRTFPNCAKRSSKVKCIRRKPVKHTCRVCNTVGVGFYWLQLHIKREHPNVDIDVLYADKRKHLCDICGTGFSSVYALRDHMNKHTGARPHACDLCPKRFRSAVLLRAHRVRHLPATLACARCGRQYKTMGNLYWHMKTHTGEKNHKCDICGKGFLYVANLNEHVRGVHYNIRRVKRGGDTGAKRTKRRKIVPDGKEIGDFSDSE